MKKFILMGLIALISVSTLFANGNMEQENMTGTDTKTLKPLVVAMELAYPPFETKDDSGKAMGISPDVARAFAQYLGRDTKIVNTSWDGLIPSLQTNKADMVISSMTITEDRAKVVAFSNPYANSNLAILTNKGSDIKTIEDLNQAGKKIAVKTGSTGFIYASKNLTKAKSIVLADESACVTEVAQGKADGFIYDQLTIYRNWMKNQDTTAAVFIPFQNPEKWGAAFNKDNTALRDQFNTFLAQFQKDGGFDDLSEKYLADEKAHFDELGFVWFFDVK